MKRFVEAFAQSGDKTEVPNTTQGDGSVSYPTGYGPDYEKNLDSDPEAKRIERQKMNQVFNDVTISIKLWQEQGYPMFVSAADNGGVAMPYKEGMKVAFTDGNIYQSLIDNNDGTPAKDHDKWSQVSGIDGNYVSGGTYKKGDIVTASNGNQYWCNKGNNGSSPVNPIGDSSDTWRQYPAKITSTNDYYVVEHFDGRVEMSFEGGISDSDGLALCQFPLGLTLKDNQYKPALTEQSAGTSALARVSIDYTTRTKTGFKARFAKTPDLPAQGERPYVNIIYSK